MRVTCNIDDVGAEVLVNGKFMGECPIDLQVGEGSRRSRFTWGRQKSAQLKKLGRPRTEAIW